MKYSVIKLFSVLIILSGLFFLSDYRDKNRPVGPLFANADEGIGAADDPNARANYEARMLMDPATGEIPAGIRKKELAFAKSLEAEIKNSERIAGPLPLPWIHRGPYHVGGRTRALAIDVTNENSMLAGSVSGGMWRSTDGGTTWNKSTSSFPGATAVAQDKRPGRTNIWYYSSGECTGTSASGTGPGSFYLGNGLYKSTDGGITWDTLSSTVSGTPQTFDLPYDLVWNIALDNFDLVNNKIYVAAISGIYKSVNGGNSWTATLGNFTSWSYFTDVATTDSGIVYATLSSDGPKKGIWRSVDGATWADISPAFFPDTANRMKIGIDPVHQNSLYILAETPGAGQVTTNYIGTPEHNSLWKYTYLSGDGTGAGGTWTDLSSSIPHGLGTFGNFNAQGGYNLVVRVSPDDSNTVFIGGTNIFRSTNAFTDTTQITQIGGYGVNTSYPDFVPYPNHHSDQHDLLFLPSNHHVMFSAADGGLYKTTDCMAPNVAWTSLNVSYTTSQFYTCAVDHGTSGSNIIIGGAQDNGSWWENSANPANTWTFSAKGDGSYCAIENGAATYYFSRQENQMEKAALDASGNPLAYTRFDPIGVNKNDYLFINPFALDPGDNNVMYLSAGRKLMRNNALSSLPLNNLWDTISAGWSTFPDTVAITGGNITALAVSTTPAHRLYYGTSAKKVYRVDNANTGSPSRTDITGIHNPNTFPSSGYVSCIAVDPTDADRVMVVFSNYNVLSLYLTKDGGTNWKRCGGNLETVSGPSVRYAAILPVSNGTVYLVATSTGMYGTTYPDSTNTTWVPMAVPEIGNCVCDFIDTRVSDGLVVVATHGAGIFSCNITDVNQVGILEHQIKKETLNVQNFPNPFTHSTEINFTLERSSFVKLKIYDSKGTEIRTICNENLSPGNHHFWFEGEGLPSGIYYCTMVSGSVTETKKIILLK